MIKSKKIMPWHIINKILKAQINKQGGKNTCPTMKQKNEWHLMSSQK